MYSPPQRRLKEGPKAKARAHPLRRAAESVTMLTRGTFFYHGEAGEDKHEPDVLTGKAGLR